MIEKCSSPGNIIFCHWYLSRRLKSHCSCGRRYENVMNYVDVVSLA